MKLTTRYFLLLAIAAVTTILFSNCNRGGGLNDDDTTLQLEFDLTEARPYQPISAVYKGGALRNQSYTGTIGSSEIVFAIAEGDNSNSVLVGLIPEGMAPGAKVISVDIDGTTYTHNITILQNETVSDPDALFDDFYTTYTAAEYAQYFDDMADFQAAINELKALPEAEKQIAAQILANNKVAVDALAQSIRDAELNAGVNFGKTGSGCDAPCKIGAVAYVLGGILSSPALIAVGASVLSALVLKRIVIPVVKALITKAWEGVKFALSLGYDRMATIAEMVYDTFLKEISNKTLALPDTIVLERGKPLKLSLKTIREPLIQESNRSQYAFVNSFLDLYNQVKAKLVPLQLALPAINEGQEVRDYATSLDGFSINVQGNSNVTASAITGTPQQARVTFNASQPGPQPFTFTYSYTNERNETTSFTQRARFKEEDPCLLNTPPVILGVNRVCNPQFPNTVFYDITFTADGVGFDAGGWYSGAPDSSLGSYPVRLEFLTVSGSSWEVAANGYSAELFSGSENNGVIRLEFPLFSQASFCSNQGNGSTSSTFHESWRIKLIDKCGQHSSYSQEFEFIIWN